VVTPAYWLRRLRLHCRTCGATNSQPNDGCVEDWLCLIGEYQRMILARLERIEATLADGGRSEEER
jgi:hypothetical protein